ncbi:MAG: prephenate dehydrogenase/arogenate dehydrogenase family protein [Candidatus Kerfeldbacteria bacterium]|nr:prephenate dehydrogenase/arogenate dehydrogenase family protein [Candidatus Kerfeldbacteria bacterium]
MTIGIIGAGRFGTLLQKHLSTDNQVTMDNPTDCALVIFAVPNRNLEQAIEQWKSKISPDAIVMDVGSIKTIPCQILQQQFPNNSVGTHPMYGPDSAGDSWQGRKMVFCKLQCPAAAYEQVQTLFTSRGVIAIECSPTEHDQMMAKSQALIHFIGRALTGLEPQQIATPDYDNMLQMMQKVTNDTWELFYDMQTLNPYAEPIRKNFIKKIEQLDHDIDRHAEPLATQRAQIDAIDEAIVRLVGERFALARQIGQTKQASGVAVQDAKRETELFLRMNTLAKEYGVPLEVVIHLYDYLMDESRKLQV